MPETQTLSTAMSPRERTPISQWFWQGGTVVALLVLIVVFTIVRPDVFLSFGNLRNILEQISILTIIAAAQTLVMVVGDFDLSVGTNATLAGATAAALMASGTPVPIAIVAALAAGALVGVVNGFLVAFMKLSAFVATLATMTTIGGLAFIVTNGTTIYEMPEEFFLIGQARPLGIPLPIFFAIATAVIVWVILRYSVLGRRLYAIGGSVEVARLSGISVRWTRFYAFTLSGLLSAIGGVILVSRLGSANPTSANSYMMLAIGAVFLGMTLLKSGKANMGGTLIGVGIIGVISNGLNILGVNMYIQQVLTGLIIIAAVTLSAIKSRDA